MHSVTAAPLVIECGIPSEAGFFGAGDEVEVDVLEPLPCDDPPPPKSDEKMPLDFPSSSSGM
jgi:hypothetical protein